MVFKVTAIALPLSANVCLFVCSFSQFKDDISPHRTKGDDTCLNQSDVRLLRISGGQMSCTMCQTAEMNRIVCLYR